jgi:lysophospholipase L1-like esterase
MMSRIVSFRLGVAAAAALLVLGASTAGARPLAVQPPAQVEIGKPAIGVSGTGLASILVPVRYPIQLAGRLAELRVTLLGLDGKPIGVRVLHERLNSGRARRPDRRRAFTFVHRVGLRPALSRRVRAGATVRVLASGRLDLDGDGKAELSSSDRATGEPTQGARTKPVCSGIPHIRLQPGRHVSVPLPACDTPVQWVERWDGTHGSARIRNGRLVYSAPERFRGRDSIELVGKRLHREATASGFQRFALVYPQVIVGTIQSAVVRALGDSVTAGFGYYGDGGSMTIGHLLECRPGAKGFNDACSSNSLNTTSAKGALEYAPDYGLANDVSWAAQWANYHGIGNYKNYAVSGSEPSDWAPGGELHATTERIEAEDPDYVLMTMGANPLLSEMLFGSDNMGCALYADVFGGYRECVEKAFAEVHLQAGLTNLYTDLVHHTGATIYLMQYHLSVPSTALAYSATQIAEMGKLLNREIAAVAAAVNPQRLQVVAPPHFDVGIDISPVYPSRFSCSELGYEVDGPSVQSNPTQDELAVLHPLSFCEGPAGGSPPWVISGDSGIHPSATGYAQMASQVPAPTGG